MCSLVYFGRTLLYLLVSRTPTTFIVPFLARCPDILAAGHAFSYNLPVLDGSEVLLMSHIILLQHVCLWPNSDAISYLISPDIDSKTPARSCELLHSYLDIAIPTCFAGVLVAPDANRIVAIDLNFLSDLLVNGAEALATLGKESGRGLRGYS
jgi:hypothetical protein